VFTSGFNLSYFRETYEKVAGDLAAAFSQSIANKRIDDLNLQLLRQETNFTVRTRDTFNENFAYSMRCAELTKNLLTESMEAKTAHKRALDAISHESQTASANLYSASEKINTASAMNMRTFLYSRQNEVKRLKTIPIDV
jgi:hypothetical protein